MRKFIILPTLLLLSLCLAGCMIKPYQVPIEQGEQISAHEISLLKPGMTKAQVEYILGTPNLADPYGTSTWYYVYSIEKDHLPRAQKEIIIHFKHDKVINLTGNYASPAKIQYTTYHGK